MSCSALHVRGCCEQHSSQARASYPICGSGTSSSSVACMALSAEGYSSSIIEGEGRCELKASNCG